MRIVRGTLQVECRGGAAGTDITERIQDFLQRHAIRDGLLVVTCLSSATGVAVGRGEPALLADLADILCAVIKEGGGYRHEDPANPACDGESAAPSLRGALLGHTVAVSIVRGRPMLTQKQRVVLIELDGSRQRAVHLQFVGM